MLQIETTFKLHSLREKMERVNFRTKILNFRCILFFPSFFADNPLRKCLNEVIQIQLSVVCAFRVSDHFFSSGQNVLVIWSELKITRLKLQKQKNTHEYNIHDKSTQHSHMKIRIRFQERTYKTISTHLHRSIVVVYYSYTYLWKHFCWEEPLQKPSLRNP